MCMNLGFHGRRWVRRWDYLAEPGYRNCTAGYAVVLNSPAMRVTTATGANKIAEHYEYAHDNLMGSIGGGGDWWTLRQSVRCWVSDTIATNPQGEAFAGIGLGSLKAAPPFANNWNVNYLAAVQLRYNFAAAQWEFSVYDCDEAAPTVEACTVQPGGFGSNPSAELRIEYYPLGEVRCFVSEQMVHRYDGARLDGLYLNSSGSDAGGGHFLTSGSHASGQMRARFTMFEAVTYGAKARA